MKIVKTRNGKQCRANASRRPHGQRRSPLSSGRAEMRGFDMTRAILVTGLLVTVLATSLSGAAQARPSIDDTSHKCGTFAGPAWNWGGYQKGAGWIYDAMNVQCDFAGRWAAKLAKSRRSKFAGDILPGGPSGWQCRSSYSIYSIAQPGSLGHCTQGKRLVGHTTGDLRSFGWYPNNPHPYGSTPPPGVSR
jgi:hypothetical protein